MTSTLSKYFFFFFNDTATTEIYTLSLHDALPIFRQRPHQLQPVIPCLFVTVTSSASLGPRSEEHTSELQSQSNLVCRLLLEKKKTIQTTNTLLTGVLGWTSIVTQSLKV